jgi:hypothetical protein
MKTYVTFGQDHTHRINGHTFDCDCVAVIECDNEEHGRNLAFEIFKNKFAFEYHEEKFKESNMRFYPRGKIQVNY